ncbi:MAG: hypothetical protein BWY91_03356 [bacterium ADurb.BinA028]|nr:MAG: hypothetical protein BWY91_03356 [bacterium ADurb.BinA028]
MSTQIPMNPIPANSSMSHSNGTKPPTIGSRKSAQINWKNALTRVAKSRKNPSAVNQCAMATIGSRASRVCPRNSRSTVHTRVAGWSLRVGSGAPVWNSR